MLKIKYLKKELGYQQNIVVIVYYKVFTAATNGIMNFYRISSLF